MTVGSARLINRKMVLVKWIQDRFMNTFRRGIVKYVKKENLAFAAEHFTMAVGIPNKVKFRISGL